MKLQVLLFFLLVAILSIFLFSLEVDGRKSLLQKDGKDSKLVKQSTILDADSHGEMVVGNHQMKKPADLEDPGDEEGESSEGEEGSEEDEGGSGEEVPGDYKGESGGEVPGDDGEDSGEEVPGDDKGESGEGVLGDDEGDFEEGVPGDDLGDSRGDGDINKDKNVGVNAKKVGN